MHHYAVINARGVQQVTVLEGVRCLNVLCDAHATVICLYILFDDLVLLLLYISGWFGLVFAVYLGFFGFCAFDKFTVVYNILYCNSIWYEQCDLWLRLKMVLLC